MNKSLIMTTFIMMLGLLLVACSDNSQIVQDESTRTLAGIAGGSNNNATPESPSVAPSTDLPQEETNTLKKTLEEQKYNLEKKAVEIEGEIKDVLEKKAQMEANEAAKKEIELANKLTNVKREKKEIEIKLSGLRHIDIATQSESEPSVETPKIEKVELYVYGEDHASGIYRHDDFYRPDDTFRMTFPDGVCEKNIPNTCKKVVFGIDPKYLSIDGSNFDSKSIESFWDKHGLYIYPAFVPESLPDGLVTWSDFKRFNVCPVGKDGKMKKKKITAIRLDVNGKTVYMNPLVGRGNIGGCAKFDLMNDVALAYMFQLGTNSPQQNIVYCRSDNTPDQNNTNADIDVQVGVDSDVGGDIQTGLNSFVGDPFGIGSWIKTDDINQPLLFGLVEIAGSEYSYRFKGEVVALPKMAYGMYLPAGDAFADKVNVLKNPPASLSSGQTDDWCTKKHYFYSVRIRDLIKEGLNSQSACGAVEISGKDIVHKWHPSKGVIGDGKLSANLVDLKTQTNCNQLKELNNKMVSYINRGSGNSSIFYGYTSPCELSLVSGILTLTYSIWQCDETLPYYFSKPADVPFAAVPLFYENLEKGGLEPEIFNLITGN